MRTVDTKWQNLATGFSRAKHFDAELDALQRAACHARYEANRRRFDHEHAAWEWRRTERCRDVEKALRVWAALYVAERQRVVARVSRGGLWALGAVVVLTAVLAVLAVAMWSCVVMAAAVLLIVFGPALFSGCRLVWLRANKPRVDHEGDPEPQPPGLEPKPTVEFSLTVTQQWWNEVSYDSRAQHGEVTPGDEGVAGFCDHLALRLPDQYMVVRGLLVRRGLDVDVLVVGPTGIWLFEVKHCSGEITCRPDGWHRRRIRYAPGGFPVSEEEPVERCDEQWLREAHAVHETLRRRLPQQGDLLSTIKGGLVFTHPRVILDIDESCRSMWARPMWWSSFLLDTPACPQLSPENQLRVLDALLRCAHRLDPNPDQRPSCAVALAEKLFSDATQHVRSHTRLGREPIREPDTTA